MITSYDPLLSHRISLLKIPVDVVDPENLTPLINSLIANGKPNQIIFLTYRNLLKARHDPELQLCLQEAALVLPVSKRLAMAAGFLKKGNLPWYTPFDCVIRILGILEQSRQSVFLLGGKVEALIRAENNLKVSFPKLQFMGRHTGYFKPKSERDILLGMRKISPTMILAGDGIKDNIKWFFRNREVLKCSINLIDKDTFLVFQGKKNRPNPQSSKFSLPPDSQFWNPFRILRYVRFWALLILYKTFKIDKAPKTAPPHALPHEEFL